MSSSSSIFNMNSNSSIQSKWSNRVNLHYLIRIRTFLKKISELFICVKRQTTLTKFLEFLPSSSNYLICSWKISWKLCKNQSKISVENLEITIFNRQHNSQVDFNCFISFKTEHCETSKENISAICRLQMMVMSWTFNHRSTINT